MKREILILFFIFIFGGIFSTHVLAATEQSITMICDVSENFTKTVTISSNDTVTINWGDGTIETIEAGESKQVSHTYLVSGNSEYSIVIKGDNIKSINSMFSEIKSIDFSNISSLESINVSNNKISKLDVSKNTNLIELKCSNNYIEEINLASFNKLETVECASNLLTSISLPSTLKNLNIYGNELPVLDSTDTFDLSKYEGLETLNCGGNLIENINISQNVKLKELYCYNNFINGINIFNNVELIEVNCSNNELSVLDVSNNLNLEVLNCSNNNLQNIMSNGKIKKLIIFGNKIEMLNVNNINFLALDSKVKLTGNSDVIIKIHIVGDGFVTLLGNTNINVYSGQNSSLKRFIINGIDQLVESNSINIESYAGSNLLQFLFTNESESSSLVNVNKPKVYDGMIPVKYNGENWQIVNVEDPEWYSYSESDMMWANVMLRDGAKYLANDRVTLIDITDSTPLSTLIGKEVPVSNTGSMYVWIPRFTYKITDNDIEIKCSEGIIDDIEDDYLIHPAFNYKNYIGNGTENYEGGLTDEDKLTGIWIAKYQASGTKEAPKYYKDGVSLSSLSIGEAFTASKINNLTEVNSHLMKNTEWGAVSYFTTAVGNLNNDTTTGNEYGIYNLETNAEYVSHYIELIGGISNYNVRKNGASLIPYTMSKFNHNESNLADKKDIDVLRLTNRFDTNEKNYNDLENIYGVKNAYGIGINKITEAVAGTFTNIVPSGTTPFFIRGIDNLYSYGASDGASMNNIGFRNVILSDSNVDIVEESSEYFVITSKFNGNGTINPVGKTAIKKGESITYVIKPESGYEIIDVKVDNVSVSGNLFDYGTYKTYTFNNVNKDHNIYVQFDSEISEYNVSVEINLDGAGTISGVGKYNSRSTVNLTAIENNGYQFIGWEVVSGGISLGNQNSLRINFVMPAEDVVLRANYKTVSEASLTVIIMDQETTTSKSFNEQIIETAPSFEGYEFYKWEVDGIELSEEEKTLETLEFLMPSKDVTLEAVYLQDTYTVSYDLNGGIGEIKPQTKKATEALILTEEIPTRENCEFLGWDTDKNVSVPEYQPLDEFTKNEDTTLFAIWDKHEVLVTIASKNSSVSGKEDIETVVELGSNIETTIPGYAFNSWKKDNEVLSTESNTSVTLVNDVTLEASFAPPTYTIRYDGNGGSGVPQNQVKTYNVSLELSSEVPTKSGYNFLGWSTDRTFKTEEYKPGEKFTINKDTTLYAIWTNSSYNVTTTVSPTNTGRITGGGNTSAGEIVVLRAIPNEGYKFIGWEAVSGGVMLSSIDNQNTTFTMPQNNVNIRGKFSLNTYTIIYDANGGNGAPSSQSKTHGTNLTLSNIKPNKTNCEFLGWSTDKEAIAPEYQVGGSFNLDKDTTLYAVWGTASYNITVTIDVANGGTVTGTGYKEHGSEVELVAIPNEGYTFKGWEVVSGEVTLSSLTNVKTTFTMPAENINIKAKFELSKYTISYNANGGSGSPSAQVKTHGTNLILSGDKPIRDGYSFEGWAELNTATTPDYLAGGTFTKESTTTLYAVWSGNTYTVNYDANGGINPPASQTKVHNITLILSNAVPQRDNYGFYGWSTDSLATTPTYKSGGTFTLNQNITLYAVWSEYVYCKCCGGNWPTCGCDVNGPGCSKHGSGDGTHEHVYDYPERCITCDEYYGLGICSCGETNNKADACPHN